MEDFLNSTSQNESYGESNTDQDYYTYINYVNKLFFIIRVMTFVIIAICLPLTLAAIYSVFSMVRNDRVVPFYIINILISDVIQLCSLAVWEEGYHDYICFIIYEIALLASVGFMVCLALERYLVIAKPLWYRFNRSRKISGVSCAVVWVSSIGLCSYKTSVIAFLLPFPMLIFFLLGTIRSLSTSVSVPSDEKRRIVGILVLVLLIYTLLFMPIILVYMLHSVLPLSLIIFSELALIFSPLADLILYVFIRKGTIDKLLAAVCCCRMESNNPETTVSVDISRSFT